jgi:methanogenic corrinoid protein MtbC1
VTCRSGLPPASESASGAGCHGPLCDLTGALVVALLAADERAVESVFGAAIGRGADLALLARDLVSPALDEVGLMWHRGEVSVAEEHLATAVVHRAFSRCTTGVPLPPPGAPRLLLSCLAGEFHELGARLAGEVARAAGWHAELLGANTPRDAVLAYIAQRRPDAVGLSCALSGHLAECGKTVEEIRRVAPGVRILVGGSLFRRDAAMCGLTGADACFADAVGLRDWLLAHRPAPDGGAAPCAPGADALRRKVCGGRQARA